MKKRVLVAMSGGVDSSVAAAILKEQGYEVISATMKIWPKEFCGMDKERSCCSLKDIEDAKRVSDKLGIKHYVLNFEKVFRKDVIDYFTSEYLKGRTPNPCIICNEKIKFGAFLKKALELECDYIATGHYARIEKNGRYKLKEAVDKSKDQSYVLWTLTQRQLKKVLFPLGELTKNKVRSIARDLGLDIYKKPDSQEICFVPNNDYSSFIKKYCSIKDKEGDIVDISGNVLGKHKGYWNFTIGQRRGLGIAAPRPLYVLEIKPKENVIVAGEAIEVKKKRFTVKDVNWLDSSSLGKVKKAQVKIRYNHKKSPAFLKDLGSKRIEIEFKEAQDAITPGQAAVFYDGEYVLGGGWIEKAP